MASSSAQSLTRGSKSRDHKNRKFLLEVLNQKGEAPRLRHLPSWGLLRTKPNSPDLSLDFLVTRGSMKCPLRQAPQQILSQMSTFPLQLSPEDTVRVTLTLPVRELSSERMNYLSRKPAS